MQIEKYLGAFLVQSNMLGRWWGNIQTVAQHTNIYIQFLILGFSATSAYGWIAASLHQWGYQLPFWMFILGVLVSIGLLGLFVWRLSIPSTFATWNFQWWANSNPLRSRMDEREKELDERLDRIEGMLQQLIQEKNESHRIDKVSSQTS